MINENCVIGKPPIADKPVQRIMQDVNSSTVTELEIEKKNDLDDRKNDPVYKAVTNVVKAVMVLSSGVEKAQLDEYLELVKTVGLELRTLLGTVDAESASFPAQTLK